MSKKNKNKFKLGGQQVGADENGTEKAKSEIAPKSQENLSYDMKKEFRNLAIVIIFILALLIGLYLYDKETHILQYLTGKFFTIINS